MMKYLNRMLSSKREELPKPLPPGKEARGETKPRDLTKKRKGYETR